MPRGDVPAAVDPDKRGASTGDAGSGAASRRVGLTSASKSCREKPGTGERDGERPRGPRLRSVRSRMDPSQAPWGGAGGNPRPTSSVFGGYVCWMRALNPNPINRNRAAEKCIGCTVNRPEEPYLGSLQPFTAGGLSLAAGPPSCPQLSRPSCAHKASRQALPSAAGGTGVPFPPAPRSLWFLREPDNGHLF